MDYVDAAAFLAQRLPEVKNENDIAAITAKITAASTFVDNTTKRLPGYFGAAPADPSSRFFRGDGTHILRIPKHITGTATVENVPISAYYEHEQSGWLYKLSQAQLQVAGEPDELSGTAFDNYPIWTKGVRYTVAARWGYEAIPADISEAVEMIVLRWWETQTGTFGQITPGGFVVERDVPPAARAILNNYVKGEFEF